MGSEHSLVAVIVKWYNARKGYGFAMDAMGKEHYLCAAMFDFEPEDGDVVLVER